MTMAPGFGMEPTTPTLHPAGGGDESGGVEPSPTDPQLASRGLRLIAFVLDWLVIAFIVGAFWIVVVFFAAIVLAILKVNFDEFRGVIAGAIGLAFAIAYFPFWWARDGQTLAMMPLGLRVVREDDGESTITMSKAIVRLIGLLIGIAVFFLGLIWTLFEKRRRGWHDLLAGTIVVGEK